LESDLLREPEHLSVEFKGFPTPRTWAMLSEQLYALEEAMQTPLTSISKTLFSENDVIVKDMIVGTIGSTVGETFYQFIKYAIDLDIPKIIENDFRDFFEITDPAKCYYLIFAITNALAFEVIVDLKNMSLKPKSKKGKKLFKWIQLFNDLYKSTNNKLLLALFKKALETSFVGTKVNSKSTVSLYVLLNAIIDNDKIMEKMMKEFETETVNINEIRNFVKDKLSLSNFMF